MRFGKRRSREPAHPAPQAAVNTNWVLTYENGLEYIESLDGIDWADATLPPAEHECTPQTRGWIRGSYVERCACGALRYGSPRPWMEKNQTREWREREARSPQR